MSASRIMVVEDEGIVAIDIQHRIRALGYACDVIVPSGEEAVARVQNDTPDLILMDIMLSGEMDGVETADIIRKKHNIPVIYITAYTDDETIQRAKISEPFGYIVKPFEDRELHSSIEMALYRHRLNRQLQESRRWLSSTLQSIGDAVMATDNDGKIRLMNQAAEKLTGVSREEALGRNISQVIQTVRPQDNSGQNQLYAGILAGEAEDSCVSFTLLSGTGRAVPVSASISAIRDENDAITGLTLVCRDITERVKNEEMLRRAEEKYRNIFMNSTEGIFQSSIEGMFLNVNPALARILGYASPEELLRTIRNIDSQIYLDPAKRRELLDSIQKQDAVSGFEFQAVRKDGSVIWLSQNIHKVTDGRGNLKYLEGALTDITQRKKNEQALKRSYEELRLTLNETVNALAALAEKRDLYTAGHQQRVSQLAWAIAQEMRLDPNSLEGIRVAGILHDIGKIYIPAEILAKPARLNHMEMGLMRSHPLVGYDILKNIPFPWPIAQTVYQHHERLDGTGYPLGLAGNNILQEARIMAVADVVEAMSSHRPYRPALGIEIALQEISANRGKFFDPNAVDACVSLFRENRFQFR